VEFGVSTGAAVVALDITERVREAVAELGGETGLCHVMVLHSTAAVVVNEFADPNIGRDLTDALERVIPEKSDWLHDRIDDNAHSHIKAALLGPSETVPLAGGELVLGAWQRLLLLEFDGPRERRVHVQIVSSS
jgi:secondary thiamine-phosphate synthase enzyme